MTLLPGGVARIGLSDGAVTVECHDERFLAGVRLRVNERAVALRPDPAGIVTADDVLTPGMLQSVTFEQAGGRALTCAFNADPSWNVEGGHTLLVPMPGVRRGDVSRMLFDGSAALPVDGSPCVFEALLAVHRMTGVLHVEAIDGAGGVLRSRSVAVGMDHGGGPDPAGYKRVSIPMPADAAMRRLAFRFEVTGLAAPVDDAPPVLFVAETWLRSRSRAARPRTLIIAADGRGPARVSGELPRLVPSDRLTLECGGEIVDLPLPAVQRIIPGAIDGMAWRVRGQEVGNRSLYVDGDFAGFVPVGETEVGLAIPRGYLNGARHHLEVRDEHGLRTLAEASATLHGTLTPYDALQSEGGRPLPHALAAQAGHRYAALRAAIERGPPPEEAAQIAHAHHVLGIGFDALRPGDVRPLSFPRHEAPDVSVVVPVHDGFAITYACLCALLLARCEATFEVVLVDDGSTDRTGAIEEIVSGITVVRNEVPKRFLGACNAGVAASRGRYVALLNNDTEPTVGWLDELSDPFHRFDDVGLTGSKLLYPDGTLQEAGGIVWRTGNPWNYGRNGNPTEPRYSYVRDADYVSGAAMMTTREIWDEVGGLSDYLAPMYFEDTDFAFKVRDSGRRVMLAALSIVYHYEGRTSGTDVTGGMKAFQEVNRPKFKTRWARAFGSHGVEGVEPDLEKDRNIVGRVLFVDNAIPRPDRDAGSYAAIEEMKLVQSLGFKVTFCPRDVTWLGSYADELQRQGIEVIVAPHFLSVEELLEARGTEFDAVYIYRWYVAEGLIDVVRHHAPRARIMFMNADLHFLREIRAAVASGLPEEMQAALRTRTHEIDVMRRADVTLSYNEVEHAVIASHAPGEVTVVKCPWVVRTRDEIPGFDERAGIAFLGGFAHPPNAEAVRWFVSEVAPALALNDVGGTFHVYGAQMPRDIADLARGNVAAPGFVENVSEAYDRHRSFVAPLRTGAGIKGKVLGALAAGIPCILSPVAAEGTGLRSGLECLVCDGPAEWVEAIARLDADRDLWGELSRRGRDFVAEGYSFERGRDVMRKAFQAAGIYSTR